MQLPFVLAILLAFRGNAVGQDDDAAFLRGHWTANDDAYARIRKDIEALAGQKGALDRIAEEAYWRCVGENPTSTDLFRWTTAVIVRARNDWAYCDLLSNDARFCAPADHFRKLGKSDSFQFSRVQFIFTSSFGFPHHSLVPLGEKILAREPTNIPVMLAVLRVYQPQAWPQDGPKGDRLVEALDKMAPNERRVLINTAEYYYRCWIKGHPRPLAEEAIRRFKAAYAKSESTIQKQAIQNLIGEMRKGTPGLAKP